MEYSKLVAVTGLPGIFELINSKTDGAIVRSLDDKTTRFVASRIHSFSQLESIEVYTVRDNVNLADIFNAMDKAGGRLPDVKDDAAVKKYYQKTYPELDFERVYVSDMKKMIKWFDVLKKNNIEIILSEPPKAPAEEQVTNNPDSSTSLNTKEKTKPVAAKKQETVTEDAKEIPKKKKPAAKKK